MIVQGHPCAFLDEKEDQAVVIVAFNGDSIQVWLEVIGIVRSWDTQLFLSDVIHALDKTLEARLFIDIIKKINCISTLLALQAHRLHSAY